MKSNLINDPSGCIWYCTVLISFSIGLHLQSIEPRFVNFIWAFIISAIILLCCLIYQKKFPEEVKDEFTG